MTAFQSTEIAQLARELRLSPLRLRLQQLAGIAHLLEIIESAKEYPYSFICFHVTGYRPRRCEDSALCGKTAIEDLVELMDDLTQAHPLPGAAAQGRLYDAEALAARLRVSTKTITRWRSRGLAGCWYVVDGQKAKLAFDGRAVQRFVARNAELVRRGSMFQLMREDERAHIIERARELAASRKLSMHVVTQQIAQETGRAVETIRYTLRRYDADHPGESVFDGREEAREVDEATLIHEASAAGDIVKELAARFGKKEAEIRRLITQGRCNTLTAEPVAYIYNAIFDAADAEEQVAANGRDSASDENADESLRRLPADLPPYLKDLYRTPLLSREEEASLFRKMNYELHGAEMIRQKLAAALPVSGLNHSAIAALIVRFDRHVAAAQAIKHKIIQANLRLVVSIAKKHLFSHPRANLFELVSDGNIALMRAVEKFDFGRGFRFSTYGSWAIMRGFARSIPEELEHTGKFQTGHDELLDSTRDLSAGSAEWTPDEQERVRGMLRASMKVLDDRERVIVLRHFGIDHDGQSCTLDEIGRDLGLSKERIRQIEVKAFSKLRGALGERGAALLAG